MAAEVAKAAGKSCLPDAVFWGLARDSNGDVRAAVAANPGCPEDVLRSLARDGDWWVRADVARNPGCPKDLLRSLAKDEDHLVRAVVALHPYCPGDSLRSLTRDKDWLVQKAARNNLSGKANPNTNLTAADSFHLPEKYAAVFASPVDPDTMFAANPTTPIDLLRLPSVC